MIGVAKLIKASAGTETGLEAAADELAAGRPALPPGSAWSELCCYVEGAMRHLAGDPGRAREVLMEGARLGASVAPSPYAIIRAQLSLLELDEGNVEEAWDHSFKALGVIERFGLEAYPTSALVFAAAALAGCRRGDSEAARERLSLAASLQAKQHDLNQWYEAETRIAMAKSRILLDDVVGARAELAIAARCAARVPDATLLRRWLEEATAAADAAGSDPGRWPLTPAELRLLHHLPTHRSFPEIAERLFVSPNTVKTQAKSIYRKFGATSRAEAVACARAAGLLSGEARQTRPRRRDSWHRVTTSSSSATGS